MKRYLYKNTESDIVAKLLCTFTAKESLQDTIDLVKSTYIDLDKVFILKLDKTQELACTYSTDHLGNLLHNTIKINRHSNTNTIYTVNALNVLLSGRNDKVLWDQYINRAILVSKGELIIHKITLFDIIKFDS